ncbi:MULTISPECIES: acyltransferase family protein [unclassified Bacillus (in: firmicutes)]|uniref:acyltransferase family protein n=1 Tax=unclassified Bacillus (in: firmicutes) TaxID=185979 RepID=UPI001596F04B|nr:MULTISPECIES: acyltransferase family protein [unclassified Bacillus (in: firmicutes)]
MPKKLINEIFLMRSIACLSILLLHSLARAYEDENYMVNLVRLLLTFGTPTFIFISEFILARSYPQELPANFWSKRIKFIMVPYVLFGTFYAFLKAFEQSGSFGNNFMGSFGQLLWRHILLGDYHGYFILVIFQFYLLHYFFHNNLKRWKPSLVMGGALLINLLYLGFFNFVKPYPTEIGVYIWEKLYWIPFFGWLFYFTLAYYCGRNFLYFIGFLNKYSKMVIVSPIIIGLICLSLYHSKLIYSISSKRVDMIFFTTSMILLIYYIATKISIVPKFFVWISQYSFGIYLIHPVFLALMHVAFRKLSNEIQPLLLTGLYFICSLLLSIACTFVLNKIPYGYYFAGKIAIGMNEKKGKNQFVPDRKTIQG